jgi:hypothetical protein
VKQVDSKFVAVAKVFHKILGSKTTLFEIQLPLTPSFLIRVVLFFKIWNMISDLPLLTLVILFILVFDLAAGVIANFTYGTN